MLACAFARVYQMVLCGIGECATVGEEERKRSWLGSAHTHPVRKPCPLQGPVLEAGSVRRVGKGGASSLCQRWAHAVMLAAAPQRVPATELNTVGNPYGLTSAPWSSLLRHAHAHASCACSVSTGLLPCGGTAGRLHGDWAMSVCHAMAHQKATTLPIAGARRSTCFSPRSPSQVPTLPAFSTPLTPKAPKLPPLRVLHPQGIEALAYTRVMIRPAGRLADQGYSEHAALGTVQRQFSGGCGGCGCIAARGRHGHRGRHGAWTHYGWGVYGAGSGD